ncbi:MAG: tRNA 2-thiocytidine biosynthesis TtcA family protein [Mycoplasmoidaceae bacterium]
MRTIIGNIIQANKAFEMIVDKDVICVGVSGGKDSMLLLESLAIYKEIVKEKLNWEIDVVGIHLRMSLCAINYDEITQYWKAKNIKFVIAETHMGEILKNQMKKGKLQCSLCSKMKKAILIEEARKHGCNKVAMGHHADDAIETFFMNLVNEGRIATFKPKMYLDRNDIWFIRPLILAREKDIRKVTNQLQIPIIPCGCPMEGYTQRDSMKIFLEEQFYKNKKWNIAYRNFLGALMNGKECDLWFTNENKKTNNFKDIVGLIKSDYQKED